MILRDALLSDFDHEMAVTRRLLDRLPEPALGWKPHEKSWSLGGLATHLAQLPRWGRSILERDHYDLVHDAGEHAKELESRAAVLETFDRHVADVRQRLTTLAEAEMLAPWSLRRNGHILMSLPRVQAFRSFVLHHLIHHRGQLSVYLRLQNVPLPPMYGATADERL